MVDTVTGLPAPTREELSEPRIHVLLIDDDDAWATSTAEVLEHQRDAFDVETATTLTTAHNRLTADVDCIVCDYDLGDQTGLDFLATVRKDRDTPFILITGQGSESVASDAIGQQVTDYIPKRSLGGRNDLLARRIETVVETYRTERALARERRSKTAILDILTETSSRDGLTAAFCKHLVAEHDYACAWIGTLDETNGLVPEAVAGADTYLDEALNPDASLTESTEPGIVAARQDDTHVVGDLHQEPAAETWRAAADAADLQSAAATPVVHDGMTLGVLAVYRSATGFTERDVALLEEYADALDYALRSAGWRESLVSATPVSIEFELSSERVPLVGIEKALPDGVQIDVLTTVVNAESLRYVLNVTGCSESAVRDQLDGDTPRLDSVTPHSEGGIQCELVVDIPTPETVLADHGGRLVAESVTDGRAILTVVTCEGTSVQSLRDAVRDQYPSVGVRSVRATSGVGEEPVGEIPGSLTEKQRQAVEIAYLSGYFERPRDNNTTEVAEKLGVSRQTFTQHLRAGQRKVFSRLFDSP